MIAVEAGRVLLAHYNEHMGTAYSAEMFFVKLIWPLFYDRPDKTMFWVANSPFTQLESVSKLQHSEIARIGALNKLKADLAAGRLIASTAVGFAADRSVDKKGRVLKWATTSSQQMAHRYTPCTAEEGYLSWIGGPTGIGVEGGCSLITVDGYLLHLLYEGWAVYRQFLTDYPTLKGRQLESWNGQWLVHRLSRRFQPDNPTNGLMPMDSLSRSVIRISWSHLAFSLAHTRHYQQDEQLPFYINRHGQTNETIGYVPMELGQIRRYYSSVARVYPAFSVWSDTDVNKLDRYAEFGIESCQVIGLACSTGSLGFAALQPKKLANYLGNIDTLPVFPDIASSTVNFPWALAHIWLREALNDLGAIDLAKDIATVLLTHLGRATWSDRLLDELTGRQPRLPHGLKHWLTRILEQLMGIIESADKPIWDLFMKEQVAWTSMFRWYFVTLVRFEFALLQSK